MALLGHPAALGREGLWVPVCPPWGGHPWVGGTHGAYLGVGRCCWLETSLGGVRASRGSHGASWGHESSPRAPLRDARPAALPLEPTDDGSEPSATLRVPGPAGRGRRGEVTAWGPRGPPDTPSPTPSPKGALCRREAAARGSTTDSAGTPRQWHRPWGWHRHRQVAPTPGGGTGPGMCHRHGEVPLTPRQWHRPQEMAPTP